MFNEHHVKHQNTNEIWAVSSSNSDFGVEIWGDGHVKVEARKINSIVIFLVIPLNFIIDFLPKPK